MFKWNRLLRRNKKIKYINYGEMEGGLKNKDLASGNSPQDMEDSNKEEYEVVEIEILPEKIICPDCGGITLEGLEFCDKCGGEL